MNKINVTDTNFKTHSFKGDDITFFITTIPGVGQACTVTQFYTNADGSRSARELGHFSPTVFASARVVDEKPSISAPQTTVELDESIDPYTAAAIAELPTTGALFESAPDTRITTTENETSNERKNDDVE